MSKVVVTTYEVIGAHEIADAHYAAVDAARKEHWAFVEEVGGCGYQPGRYQAVVGVLFDQLPPGWRKSGSDNGKIKAVPHNGSKLGKSLHNKIMALPVPPSSEKLASDYGYNPSEFPIDGTSIYFATALQLTFPAKRTFLRIPRTSTDGFEPDEAILQAIPESQFMAAIEAHNAEAKRQREGGAA